MCCVTNHEAAEENASWKNAPASLKVNTDKWKKLNNSKVELKKLV